MENLYNLTSPQHSIWLAEQFDANTSLNNIGGYVFIRDCVDFNSLGKALKLYAQKNAALNFKITIVDGEPKQYISNFEDFDIDLIELQNQEEVEKFNENIINTPFSFLNSRLYKFTLFKLPNGTGGFNATLHHIISDAWNMSLLIDEVMKYYSSLIHNEELDLADFPSYVDYITSEEEYLQSNKFEKDHEFWNSVFSSTPELTYIVPNNKDNTNTVAVRESYDLDSNLYEKITSFCKAFNCSAYTFFMTIFSLYIAKINNTHTSIIGTPVLNRSNFKEKHTAGMFISTVPFKMTFDSNSNFSSFLKDVASMQLSIFRHQKYPYDQLLSNIKNQYDISDNLYDIALSYQNAKDDKNSSSVDYSSNWLFAGHSLNTLQIHFYDMDDSGTPKLYYDYQVSKLNKNDIENLHNRIIEMSQHVLDNPDILLKDIEIVTTKEKELLLNNFNTSDFSIDNNNSLVSIFENEANSNLNKDAVIFEDTKLTYAELNDKANALANLLLKKDVGRNTVIGIMLPRSLELSICVWAVLKSGNGYLLIDPSLPEDRIKYMLENANVSLLITNSDMNIDFNKKIYMNKLLEIPEYDSSYSENINISTDDEDIFCVIYTSGSTGTPKGVMLKRIGVINMLYSYKHFLYTDTCDMFLSTSTVAFDMFIVENFISLLSGKTVVLANDDEQKVPVFMSDLIKKHNIDFILSTPSKISLLLSNNTTASCLQDVKVIQLGGEVFKEHLYNELANFTNAKIFNGYGPSECTACCSNKEIISGSDINIGKPFLNTSIYLLNSDMNLLPIGYEGELCVSGLGVGSGYINNDELTNKSFVLDPFAKKPMYKTGDMGKYLANGELIYLGRRDAQVKLRGLRIELDEITNKLASLDGISNAVSVIKKVNNIDCICSYVVATDKTLSINTIKQLLSEQLPYYMIPSHIVFLDSLPITLNGKINTKLLPDIFIDELEYIAPQTETEIVLENLWNKILNTERISIKQNFFDLGGDSLCSIKLISEIYSALNAKISIKDIFAYPTIETLANYIDSISLSAAENTLIEKSPVMDFYPLSSAQKRIYYTIQLNPKSVNYNTPGGLVFDKLPNINKLEKCFYDLLDRHSSLRTCFVIENEEVVQKIIPLDKIDFKLNFVDSVTESIEDVFNEFVKPFDLEQAPLFRAELHKFADDKFILFIDMSHIICDGESVFVFVDELRKLYNGEDLIANSIDYIDYAVWENNKINSQGYDDNKKYWLKQFEDELPILHMPTNYSRPTTQSFDGAKVYTRFENNKKVFELCNKLNTTPYIFLLSIYYVLLYKYTNQNDIIVGSPIVGRDNSELSNVIGMFVNTIALRTHINPENTFSTFLDYVTRNCLDAFENQTYPFDELLKDLALSRDVSRNPLFDTMFIYQNNGRPEINLEDLHTEFYIPDNHTSKFDFSLEITPNGDNFELSLEYCTKLFDEEFMDSFLQHYINILNSVIDNINIQLTKISIISDNELNIIMNKFNNNSLNYPKDKSIVDLFREQVVLHPNNIAVSDAKIHYTYSELNEHVKHLSYYLNSIGIKKGDIVCTLLPRSTNLIISLLAIMNVGAIYLPISPSLPIDRIHYIIENSTAKNVISSTALDIANEFNPIFIDTISYMNMNVNNFTPIKTLPDDIIYTIYTSGSTGAPKGVQITNKNLNNFIHSFNEFFENTVNSTDICLSTTSISFDVSIWEIFFTLLNGAHLYLYEKESIDDIFDFCNCLVQHNITMAYIPPNILDETYSILSQSTHAVKLQKILIGVEPIKTAVIKKFFLLNPNMKIVNGYGPTETTICSTAFVVKNVENIEYNIIPIGRPLYNNNAFVLDSNMNLLPPGIPGELYINGDNVGHGYLNNTSMTNSKYIPCPFKDNGIMYNTGDIVKWMPDGNLMFVGRNDDQIKIKGHRIEINEIVNAISEYPSIAKCVVIVKENSGNKMLVAYFTANQKIVINDLRSFLTLKLPFYNIPNFLIQLNKFVLTANGKIDFKYLRNLPIENTSTFELPRNDFEEKMVTLWKEFLNVDKIGINDNFFDLGGDSLIAIKLQIEAFKFGIDISYGDIFSYPTIKQLSDKASSTNSTTTDIQDYNYNEINELISKNDFPIVKGNYPKVQLNNIMLTGVTGFVGIHILARFLSKTHATVYCLVRNKNNVDYISRLKKVLNFYFGNKYDKFLGNRIQIVQGDITQNHFGLDDTSYEHIGNTISCIINSAAIVKHYGKSPVFDNTNIDGVKNIINFCKQFNIKLYHISTLSVSGNVFAEDDFSGASTTEKIIFKENNLFVNQDLSNIYLYTKFMAERLILDNVSKNNLNATIIRLGNITSRITDGQFQINISENAFLNRLVSFIQLGYMPNYLKDGYTEFTPVDCCAHAIYKIVQHDLPFTILHLFNNNHINLEKLIEILEKYDIKIDVVGNDIFLQKVDYILQHNKNILSGIINDFDTEKKLVYDSNVTLNNEFTNAVLKCINFSWPKIDEKYIYKYIRYLRGIGYIN